MDQYTYSKENLAQCIQGLFTNTVDELERRYNFREEFNKAIEQDIPLNIRWFSRWNNEGDCFSATSLSFWRIEGSKLIIELAVYDKYSGYKATFGVGYCDTPEEIFEWLETPGSIQKCIECAEELIEMFDD